VELGSECLAQRFDSTTAGRGWREGDTPSGGGGEKESGASKFEAPYTKRWRPQAIAVDGAGGAAMGTGTIGRNTYLPFLYCIITDNSTLD